MSWLYDVVYSVTAFSVTVYTISPPCVLYFGNFVNVYVVPDIVSDFTYVPSAYKLIVIVDGLFPSWFPLSFHTFVILTVVSTFTGTVISLSSSVVPSLAVAVATFAITVKFAQSASVTV